MYTGTYASGVVSLSGNQTVAGDKTFSGTTTITTADINGGNIDGTTIATSDVTVGTGKTLNVSDGTLTTSAAQNLAIIQGASNDVDIGAHDLRAATVTADSLTSGKMVFTGTDGLLSVDENMSFSSDTLTVKNISITDSFTINESATATTISSVNLDISDSLITLNNGLGNTVENINDCGILINLGDTENNAFMGWDESEEKFHMGLVGTADGSSTGSLSITTGTLVANLVGDVTGSLANCTGLPISTGVSGLGSNVATFLATPSSSNLISAITDETGSECIGIRHITNISNTRSWNSCKRYTYKLHRITNKQWCFWIGEQCCHILGNTIFFQFNISNYR